MLWRSQMADVPFEGIYRRQVDLDAPDAQTVVGWLEDESHHFGITLVHDGAYVREVRMASPRYPWATCADAGRPLQAFVGQPLVARASQLGAVVDMRLQCTHLFDLASLMVAHAHAGRRHRRYHGTVEPLAAVVPGAPEGWQRATLYRDGAVVLHWDLHDDRIVGPAAHAGRALYHGFREWTETLAAEDAEQALVLRRVAFVSNGRRITIEHLGSAAELGQGAVCHSFQPGQRERAIPIPNSRRRYDINPQDMLARVRSQP
ncbi:DUF2889 domain-containing protein [Aromatoleum toluclasticum]|uniref:DUF2889 domain-containing protein n=1 Tax=Aromatoleum toluclasticum TaxID=92003 RepID=UPI001D190214|nr:DUF2889 domain-containing protein [Aromatoleum toluclasticum]MCC4114872.1 DUF2889 domain-containing protein [Aromatoleum toluclasticum]